MVIPELVDQVDKSKTMSVVQQQGFVGVLLITLIGIITYASLWVAPETIKTIATQTRTDVREALLEMNAQHAKEDIAKDEAFTKEQDRTERILGGKTIKGNNPVAGALQ